MSRVNNTDEKVVDMPDLFMAADCASTLVNLNPVGHGTMWFDLASKTVWEYDVRCGMWNLTHVNGCAEGSMSFDLSKGTSAEFRNGMWLDITPQK